jgi:hypothetical protein
MSISIKFQTGKISFSQGVNEMVNSDTVFALFVIRSLARHSTGDWGQLCAADKKANDAAALQGERILSSYEAEGLPKIWIITEADRAVTTAIFPNEY